MPRSKLAELEAGNILQLPEIMIGGGGYEWPNAPAPDDIMNDRWDNPEHNPRFYVVTPPLPYCVNFAERPGRETRGVQQGRFNRPFNWKGHRNFRWLPYRPWLISEVAFESVDVLSGPFSGCFLVYYRRNGGLRVGHIGTGPVENANLNNATKNQFIQNINEGRIQVIAAFDPLQNYQDQDHSARDKRPNLYLGLVTGYGELRTIAFENDMDGTGTVVSNTATEGLNQARLVQALQ